jgi:integrase
MGGGLRVSEVTGLRWCDVDIAAGTFSVIDSKTEAGKRTVSIDASLRKELAAHKLASRFKDSGDYVFPGRHRTKKDGTIWDGKKRRDRNAVTKTVLYPAIKRANDALRSACRADHPRRRDVPLVAKDVRLPLCGGGHRHCLDGFADRAHGSGVHDQLLHGHEEPPRQPRRASSCARIGH